MTDDVSGPVEYAHELSAGQSVTMVALVIALHENGILPQDKYTEVLYRLWSAMPEEKAVGEAGEVIERVLDFLCARACAPYPSYDGEHNHRSSALARRPANDDAVARPAPRPAP